MKIESDFDSYFWDTVYICGPEVILSRTYIAFHTYDIKSHPTTQLCVSDKISFELNYITCS